MVDADRSPPPDVAAEGLHREVGPIGRYEADVGPSFVRPAELGKRGGGYRPQLETPNRTVSQLSIPAVGRSTRTAGGEPSDDNAGTEYAPCEADHHSDDEDSVVGEGQWETEWRVSG